MTFSALCFSFSLMGCIISCILVDETFIVKNYHWWCNFCRLFTEDALKASLQSAYAGWSCLKQPILLDFDPGPFLLQLFYLPSYTYCTPKPLAGHLSLEQSILLKCIPCYGGIKNSYPFYMCKVLTAVSKINILCTTSIANGFHEEPSTVWLYSLTEVPE